MPDRALLALELAALAVLAAASWWLLGIAEDAWLARATAIAADRAAAIDLGGAPLRFTLGIAALAVGRVISTRRARDPLPAGLLVPAVAAACLLGLVIHASTVEVSGGALLAPGAARHAGGFALAGIAGGVILATPAIPAPLVEKLQPALLAAIVGTFLALGLFGSGPASTRINLGPIQPIELVKIAAVLFCAGYLGRRASKLRWQRQRWLGLRWPRPRLLVPAMLVVALVFAALYLVRDLGPTLVLAPVFIGMFYVATRASGWAVAAMGLVIGALAALWLVPSLAGDGTVATRILMWKDPWTNGLDNGSQLGESLWAIAAGGLGGQGLAESWVPGIPAGKTDLIIATSIEQIGLFGFAIYALVVAVIAAQCFLVAANNRTPERALIAAGIGLLLIVQWALIAAGTFGVLPLTGVVAPFLSSGRTGLVAFVAACALVARLAEDGRQRVASEALIEIRAGVRGLAMAALIVFAVVVGAAAARGWAQRSAISARGLLTTLADGTVRHRQNPRLLHIARMLRRGALEDRRGEALAFDPAAGAPRRYPLGSAMGRVIGWRPGRACPPPWSLELLLDERLRGYPERDDPPAVRPGGCPGEAATEPIASPDLRRFVPLLEMAPEERREQVGALDDEVASRSVRLTIDARLQRAAAAALRAGAAGSPVGSGAAVVVKVDSGEVLARAQVPDLDPADRSGRARFEDPTFAAAYGPWRDKTHLEGVYQTGSIGKLVTAIAAARTGELGSAGGRCQAPASPELVCAGSFEAPRWGRPIHDHAGARPHGSLDLVTALEVSCNVYFAQLALRLGPDPFRAMVRDGIRIGHFRRGAFQLDPGPSGGRKLGETGFGQGGLAMSALQAARLVAAIGDRGLYRVCPPTMELGADCESIEIVADPDTLRPILAGMNAVMEGARGTGRRLRPPGGVRVYAKTGTADVLGMVGEQPYGVALGRAAPPHSWFVALAEPAAVEPCALDAPGRVAVAVVIPRGGGGSGAAGRTAMAIIGALDDLGYFEP